MPDLRSKFPDQRGLQVWTESTVLGLWRFLGLPLLRLGEKYMIVTDIKQQKNDRSKYSVYVDGEYAFSLIAEDIAYFKIKVNEEIPEDRFNFIVDTNVYIKAQDTALKYIGYKMRTEKEVRNKLIEKDFSESITERVIEFLLKYKYVDDYEYCMAFIRQSLKLNPLGTYGLRYKLKSLGINDKYIERAIYDSEIDEEKYAKILFDKKIRTKEPKDEKDFKKLQDFLLRKGFSYDIIKLVIDEYKKNNKQ